MFLDAYNWIYENAVVEEKRVFILKRACLAFVLYLAGYCNTSLLWLGIIIALWIKYDKHYEHKRILEVTPLPSKLPTEEQIIRKQFDEQLPAWVSHEIAAI